MKKILLAVSAAALMASCGSESTEGTANSTGANTTPTNTPATAQTPAAAPDNQANPGAPAVSVNQSAAAPAANANVKDPNPAHGQPGHRCDIPVGASLSTPVQQPASGQSQQIQVQPQATPAPAKK